MKPEVHIVCGDDSTASGFSAIGSLFFSRRPAAVGWLVPARILDSFKGFVPGPLTHIGKKARELHPASRDANSASAVSTIVCALRIGASLDHVHPRNIRWRSVLPGPMSMLGFLYSRHVRTKAATTFRLSAAEIRSKDGNFIAARTLASPARKAGMVRRTPENTESAESFADQIVQEHKCRGIL